MQKEYIGAGSIGALESILAEYSAKKVFLVTGHRAYTLSGVKKELDRILAGCQVQRFSDFTCNPKIEDVNRGVEIFKKILPDIVIAGGGGSVIDMAKLIRFFAVNKLKPSEYSSLCEKKVRLPKPLVAIATTAGSGSEATHFAVVYVGHKKCSVAHEYILPDAAIVDSNFVMSLPAEITAAAGMDALSQAVESYWSVKSNNLSKEYAEQAIEIIMANLEAAVNKPAQSVCAAMAKAAHLAGKAINITKTTAAHAVSYPITSYFDVAHGQAVGLILPVLFQYNADVCEDDTLDPRGAAYVRDTLNRIAMLLGANDAGKAKEKLEHLMMNIGLKTRLNQLGVVSDDDVEIIIKNGFEPERVKNNPRKLTEDGLREMLQGIR